MMRVTFTCEKCGGVLRVIGRPNPEKCAWPLTISRDLIPDCPNCAKLSYGPLTEEMLAEALHVSYHAYPIVGRGGNGVTSAYQNEARFVLRLLNDIKENWYFESMADKGYGAGFNWRDWLLDLARRR